MPVLVYDLKLRRPACALLQAAMGGSPGIAGLFPSEHWLVSPTPDMKAYNISEGDLAAAVEHHKSKSRGER